MRRGRKRRKLREFLRNRRWKWTAGGITCLVIAAMIFALSSGFRVEAENITISNESINFETTTEDGTIIYLVEDAQQLLKLGSASSAETAGKTFRLKQDITISSITAPADGTFAGTFDGNGYVIVYNDINIAVADDAQPGKEEVNGLLFGEISSTGKVGNLIIDIQAGSASYQRSSGTQVVETAGELVHEPDSSIKELDFVSVLGMDGYSDAVKAEIQEILNATPEEGENEGTSYRKIQKNESGTITTTYTEASDRATDYFGLLCGKNSGTINQVYITGKPVSIVRNEKQSQAYSESVQTGTVDVVYCYEQGIDTRTEEVGISNLGSDASQENNGLTASLTYDAATTTYTLTLENKNTAQTDSGILSNDITILSDSVDGWTVDSTTTAQEFNAAGGWKIAAGEKAILTKTVAGDSSTGDGNTGLTVNIQGTLTTEAYQFKYSTCEVAADTFTGNDTATSGTPISSGNYLYAGGITGCNSGTISEVKQSVDLTGTVVEGEFAIGGIAGEAENISGLSKLYMLGKVNDSSIYIGKNTSDAGGSGASQEPADSAKTEDEAEGLGDTAGWSSYIKYNTQDSNAATFYDLAWLIRICEEDDSGTMSSGTSFVLESLDSSDSNASVIPVTLANPVRGSEFAYTIAYKARKNMTQLSEDMVHVEEAVDKAEGSISLGESAFYTLLNAYATDGYYHYAMEEITEGSEKMKFPYDNDANPYTVEKLTFKYIRKPLIQGDNVDMVSVTLPEGSYVGTDKLYYSINAPDNENSDVMLPTDSIDNTTYCEAAVQQGSAELTFNIPEVRYGITPYIGGHIYPMIVSGKYGVDFRGILPAPGITVFDFFDVNGEKNKDAELAKNGIYEAGSEMGINTTTDTDSYDPVISYVYSDVQPTGEWSAPDSSSDVPPALFKMYVGDGGGDGLSYQVCPEKTMQVPETAGTYYLYIKLESKYHTAVQYCYGPFQVAEKGKIGGKVYGIANTNAPEIEGNSILDGDFMYLNVDRESGLLSDSIQYMISDTKITDFTGQTWVNYTKGTAIKLERKSKTSNTLYVYARFYDAAESKYGEITTWSYQIGADSVEVSAVPPTISYQSGESYNIDAAVTLQHNDKVGFTAANDVQIYYIQSDSKGTELKVERQDNIVTGDGYCTVGGRCYYISAGGKPATFYSGELTVQNTTGAAKELHFSVVSLEENCNPGTVLNYVYKVDVQQQVAAPESVLETNMIVDGRETGNGRADISKGAMLTFTSMTPQAEIYYWIGDKAEGEGTKVEDGVRVTGTGTTYTITLVAKQKVEEGEEKTLLDSNPVTFIYNITEAQQTDTPTATPVTSEASPTVVIPGEKIFLSTTTTGAKIYYELGGGEPVLEENPETGEYSLVTGYEYNPGDGIVMPKNQSGFFKITAVAVKSGLSPSSMLYLTYAYPSAVQPPYASVNSGAVSQDTSVLLKNRTEGATIYYTVAYGGQTPEDPTINSSVFDEESPFVIIQETVIKAIAVKDGVVSEVVTFTYTPHAQLEPPKASIESGSMISKGTVLTLEAAEGATIYYTTDGSDPKEDGNKAVMTGNSIILNGEGGTQITIKAYASVDGRSDSEVVTFTYLFSQNSGGVTADVPSGSLVSRGSKINLMTDITDAEIYYTINGDSPVDQGIKGTTVTVEGTPGTTFTIKAVAVINGSPGTVVSFTYKIKEIPNVPSAVPAGGVLTIAVRVDLSSNVEKIYYTTDGSEPTKSSTPYTEPILINRTTTLKAIAVSEDGEISEIGTYIYTAAEKAAEVVSTDSDGTVLEPGDTISLSTDTNGAVIYYSTDGTEPNLGNLDSMFVYNGEEIEINRSVTIQAVAYREDLRLSDVAVWNYTVETIPAVEQKKLEAAKLAEEGLQDTDATALARSYETADADFIRTTRETENGTLVSYTMEAMGASVVLKTDKVENDPLSVTKVKEMFGETQTVLGSYEFIVKKGNSIVQPRQEVEIAIPIPEGYEDAVLNIASVDSQYKLTNLVTRREGDMLYAKTSKIGSYVVVGPERENEERAAVPYLLILEIAAGIALLAGAGYYAREKWGKYQSRKKNYPKE